MASSWRLGVPFWLLDIEVESAGASSAFVCSPLSLLCFQLLLQVSYDLILPDNLSATQINTPR
jgi:hypothetical protein